MLQTISDADRVSQTQIKSNQIKSGLNQIRVKYQIFIELTNQIKEFLN